MQFVVVRPSGNRAPGLGVQDTGTGPSTMSRAVGSVYVTDAPFASVASTLTFRVSILITGATVSRTVTANWPLAWFPDPSVAVQVTVVVPNANVLPDAGAQDGVRAPLTVSVAVAV